MKLACGVPQGSILGHLLFNFNIQPSIHFPQTLILISSLLEDCHIEMLPMGNGGSPINTYLNCEENLQTEHTNSTQKAPSRLGRLNQELAVVPPLHTAIHIFTHNCYFSSWLFLLFVFGMSLVCFFLSPCLIYSTLNTSTFNLLQLSCWQFNVIQYEKV